MQNVLDGVGVIHSAGIIHRDLKPENLLLNGDYQVKICDFSVCLLKGEQPNLKLVSDVVGTIDYLAPECLRGGEYSTISDLYSVAITCFELLTGTLPFSSQSINQSLERKVSGSIELLPKEISKEFPNLQDFFQKALSPKTENRFQTHLEMKNAIDDVIGNIYEHSKSEGIGSNKKNIRLERFRSFKVLIGEALNLKNVFSLKNFVRFDKKVGAKFFLLSFLVTIASFSLLNLIGDPISVSSDLEGLDPLANREQGSIENSVTNGQIHQSLLSYPGIGILRGLYTENKDYRFVVTPVGKEKIIFGLLVKGWQPVEIDLSLLKNEKPIHIVGKGVDVLMQVDSFGPNDTIEGTFENIVTARTGKWSLSFVKD